MSLTSENYRLGMLVDDDLLGGVSEDPGQPGRFLAFVLRSETGEYVGYNQFETLSDALAAINAVQRSWNYEATSECGGGKCTKCKGGCKRICGNEAAYS